MLVKQTDQMRKRGKRKGQMDMSAKYVDIEVNSPKLREDLLEPERRGFFFK
jgi:hypothetical protein